MLNLLAAALLAVAVAVLHLIGRLCDGPATSVTHKLSEVRLCIATALKADAVHLDAVGTCVLVDLQAAAVCPHEPRRERYSWDASF